jgi:peptide/nickel transport system ATP-binding protein
MAKTMIEVNNLKKHYPLESSLITRWFGGQQYIHAVDDINFTINKGEIFGLAGESGCGKTTTGRCLARLTEPTSGKIKFGSDMTNIANYEGDKLRAYRRRVQMVFQDPYGSINDRFRVRQWIREPLVIHEIGNKEEKLERVITTLDQCGLKPAEEFLDQYPHELSGGQRQRVALARAMVIEPEFIVADEPTSMLDVSVRSGILNIFKQLVEEQNITILYISHDLSLLRYISDRIGIMYQGQLMEIGDAQDVLRNPKHPYTQSLISAVPRINPLNQRERIRIPPDVEEKIGEIEGCPFRQRCPHEFGLCNEELPMITPDDTQNQHVACHLYRDEVNEKRPVQSNQLKDGE